MENKIKMEIKNENGDIIEKEIPEDLSAFYKNAGWEFSKEKKEETKPVIKDIELGSKK